MSAGACVWSGIILDPGFQNVPAGAWTLQKGAVIQAAAGGNIEAGQLFVDKATLCTSRGRASQSVVIPALADVGPLSLRVASNGDCTNSSGSCTGSGTSIIVNGGVNIAPYHALSTIDQICLGDRAYGGSMSVVVRPSSRAVCVAATTLDAVVDHVSIETGANCPTPGTLPDGGFESTPSNWTPSVTTANSPPPVAEIKAGIGTAGSMAAHLNTNDRCQQAMITGPTSPPTALPNAAIQFSYKGTAGERMIIQQGGVPIASTLANGTQQVGKACLLESNKGVTQSTTFGILLNGSSGCGAYVKDFVIDDLAFVSDTTCPTTSLVPDPGFERADPAGMWSPLVSNNGVAAGVAFAGVSAVASEARSGSHSFKLVNNVGCGNAQVSFPVTVGPSGATAGPALQFYYRAPVLSSSSLTVTGNIGTPLTVATVATTYAPQVLCLDPTTTGQTTSITMNLTNLPSVGCSVTYTAETVWIDDLSVTTDPSCPID